MLDIATDKTGSRELIEVHLRGNMDAISAADFDRFFNQLLKNGTRYYVLNTDRLQSLSSAGISSLIRLARNLDRIQGIVVLVRPDLELQNLLTFFNLQATFPFFENRSAAVAYIKARMPAQNMANQSVIAREYLSEEDSSQEHSLEEETDRLEERSRPIPETTARPMVARSPGAQTTGQSWQATRQGEAASQTEDRYDGEDGKISDHSIDYFTAAAEGYPEEDWPDEKPVQPFRAPLITRCENCGVRLRVYQNGLHICAGCGIEFDVEAGGQTYYMQST